MKRNEQNKFDYVSGAKVTSTVYVNNLDNFQQRGFLVLQELPAVDLDDLVAHAEKVACNLFFAVVYEGSVADFNHNSDKEAKELVDNAFQKIEDKKKMKDWLAEECVVVAYMVRK